MGKHERNRYAKQPLRSSCIRPDLGRHSRQAVPAHYRVDNRIKEINVGPDSHSITDQTQGNWNGIVGKIELQTTPKVYFDDIQVYPDLSHGKALVRMNVKSSSSAKGEITLSAESFNTDTRHNVLLFNRPSVFRQEITG